MLELGFFGMQCVDDAYFGTTISFAIRRNIFCSYCF